MSFSQETLERTELQGEPDWLRERRRAALADFQRLPMPSRHDEEWRRTDIAGLDPASYARFEHSNGAAPAPAPQLPKGVIYEPLAAAAANHAKLVEPVLFTLLHHNRDRFAALHSAFFTGGNFLYVPDGVTVDEPILGRHFSHESGTSVLPHTLIVAGKNSRFNYLDEYIADGDEGEAYRSGSAEIFAGEGSEVGYVAIQKWGRDAWHFGDQRARVDRDATLKLFSVTLGGKFSKNRIEASLVGPGATAELKAIYFASGEQFFDFHTLQDHQVGNTTSDLLFKGALQDTARTVYAGLIKIEKHAARSDAYQANRNLVLSDKAKATSIPMLEIDNNDVRCTHGATVGPVDPNHLFYLESRGISESTAKRMLIQGFFGQVLDRIPFEEARTLVETELESRIG
jgi:Fe-S cluster assembly protein SufD